MKTYKFLAAGLAAAGMLMTANAALAQTATGTPTSGTDLAVSIGGSGITLSAANSNQPVSVSGLPFSISGAIGGTCQLNNNGTAVGTVGTSGMVQFTNPIVVPAGGSVTLPVTCTGSTQGTYNVSLVTSTIPATVGGFSITPRGVGGGADNDTVAVGTLTINSTGTVGGISGGTSGGTTTGGTTTGGTTTGGVLGTSTSVPNIPNTGAGGQAAATLAILAAAGLAALAALKFRQARA